jgi:hypothetical protein
MQKGGVDKVEDSKRLEQQISQLISMTAKNNELLLKMQIEISEIRTELTDFKAEFQKEKDMNQSRYDLILSEVRNQNYVLNHHRDKISRNEEEISKIRQMIQT